jgi:hypothetical protein
VGKGTKEGGPAWDTAWRRGVRVAAGRASGGAGSRPGGAATRDRGGVPRFGTVACGLCQESVGRQGGDGKWAGPTENSTLLNLFKIFQKDLN